MSLRTIKDRARAQLHDRMRVETLCYVDGPSGSSTTVYPRVNSKDEAVGDLAGTSLAYGERHETIPKLIFLVSEHTPARGNVYVVSATEAYRVNDLEPQDGISITANCVRLKNDSELAAYTAPGA